MSHRAVHIVHPRLTDLREPMCTRLLFEENPTAKPVWGRKNEVPISNEKEKPSKKQQILSQTHNRIRAKVKNLSFVRVNLHNFNSSQVCILAHLGSLTLLSSACIKRPKVSASIGFLQKLIADLWKFTAVTVACSRPLEDKEWSVVRTIPWMSNLPWAFQMPSFSESKEFCDVTNI